MQVHITHKRYMGIHLQTHMSVQLSIHMFHLQVCMSAFTPQMQIHTFIHVSFNLNFRKVK